jgi:hypothetical protein
MSAVRIKAICIACFIALLFGTHLANDETSMKQVLGCGIGLAAFVGAVLIALAPKE